MLGNKILLVCLGIEFPESGMETYLNNFNIGLKIKFRIIATPHT